MQGSVEHHELGCNPRGLGEKALPSVLLEMAVEVAREDTFECAVGEGEGEGRGGAHSVRIAVNTDVARRAPPAAVRCTPSAARTSSSWPEPFGRYAA